MTIRSVSIDTDLPKDIVDGLIPILTEEYADFLEDIQITTNNGAVIISPDESCQMEDVSSVLTAVLDLLEEVS